MAANRTALKRQAIVDAAREQFLERGYVGASMDAVAAAAQVSKQTVYKHFRDKRSLFTELLTADMASADDSVDSLGRAVPQTQDLEEDLTAFARAYLRSVMQPNLIRLRRLVIGEAERFPELARAWYEKGPESAFRRFTEWFEVLTERGLLRTDDPRMAAEHFNWLVLSTPLNKAMAEPHVEWSEIDLNATADAGVKAFLAAYSAPKN